MNLLSSDGTRTVLHKLSLTLIKLMVKMSLARLNGEKNNTQQGSAAFRENLMISSLLLSNFGTITSMSPKQVAELFGRSNKENESRYHAQLNVI